MCGTLDYLPPEMVTGEPYSKFVRDYLYYICRKSPRSSPQVDHWTVGVLTYEFLTGVPPFEAQDQNATYKRILTVDLRIPQHVSTGAEDLIRKVRFECVPVRRIENRRPTCSCS